MVCGVRWIWVWEEAERGYVKLALRQMVMWRSVSYIALLFEMYILLSSYFQVHLTL